MASKKYSALGVGLAGDERRAAVVGSTTRPCARVAGSARCCCCFFAFFLGTKHMIKNKGFVWFLFGPKNVKTGFFSLVEKTKHTEKISASAKMVISESVYSGKWFAKCSRTTKKNKLGNFLNGLDQCCRVPLLPHIAATRPPQQQ